MARSALRLRAVQVGYGLGALVLIARAAQVQLVDGAAYERNARAQRTERIALPPTRGAIYDRNHVPLALTHETFHVGVAPDELQNVATASIAIVENLAQSMSYVTEMFERDYAYFHGPFNSSDVQPLRGIRGVYLTSELTRYHPNPDFARAALGRPLAPGRPASGIERVLDTLLTGREGSAVVLRDQFGRRYESPSRLDAFPVPGHDVYLTIDAELQDIVERSLAEAIDRLGAAGGDVLVLDPTTGEVLAVAARRADGSAPASVFTSVFEPGSTAKIFAAAALLRHGLVSPTDSVWGENGRYTLGNRVIEDDHVEQWLTLRGVVRRSSNIGIVKFADRLTPEQQYAMLRAFGLGTRTGVEFPVESAGLLSKPSKWSSTTAASLAIGYEVAVTTLQLAAAYAAIANGGILLRPTLVHRVVAPDGKEVYRHRPEPVRRVVGESTARELREMLRDAVSEGGTGTTAALVRYEVAGKTGTARRAGPNGYVAGSYTASFASMFPADDPQLVMVVKLEDPRGTYASATAAPLTRSVLEQILAAQTEVLDLAATPSVPRPGPPVDDGIVPYVLTWPAQPRGEQELERVVPDVIGLRVRAAARRLHQSGLRVRYIGSGPVDSVTPAPGTRVRKGALVTVIGSRGGLQ